jgi:ribosomal protein S18 acetylase RimI-like enzyme
MVNVRQATEADIVKASRLWLEMLVELTPQFASPNVGWWRKLAIAGLREGNRFILVADEGGRLIGFVDWCLYPDPSDGQIHAVGQHTYLKPEYRGRGIGDELYRKAIEAGKKFGVKVVDLFCMDNEKPKWEKRGYKFVMSFLRKEV